MINAKLFSGFIFIIGVFFFFALPVYSAENNFGPNESIRQKSMSVRESEILGTLEKPQFSTEIPWKSPLFNNLRATEFNRSFRKEIFRPINLSPELKK